MNPLLDSLGDYLKQNFGINVEIRLWDNQKNLKFFLTEAYDFYETFLFKQKCVFMVAKAETEITPGKIEKHQRMIKEEWPGLYIYVYSSVSSHNRMSLIQNKTPFIIPGKQMFLLELGVDLQEHFSKYDKKKKFLSPAATAIIIYVLLEFPQGKITPSTLAKSLKYSVMSMTRALNEFKLFNIGTVHKEGRELCWTIENRKALWGDAKEFMQSPVKKRIWLKKQASLRGCMILAGFSAIAHYSMLNPPRIPIYALSSNALKKMQFSKDEILSAYEEADAELEIWQYDPFLFESEGYVDPFSLYLSLKENEDVRVETAIEFMMEKIKW